MVVRRWSIVIATTALVFAAACGNATKKAESTTTEKSPARPSPAKRWPTTPQA